MPPWGFRMCISAPKALKSPAVNQSLSRCLLPKFPDVTDAESLCAVTPRPLRALSCLTAGRLAPQCSSPGSQGHWVGAAAGGTEACSLLRKATMRSGSSASSTLPAGPTMASPATPPASWASSARSSSSTPRKPGPSWSTAGKWKAPHPRQGSLCSSAVVLTLCGPDSLPWTPLLASAVSGPLVRPSS